MKQGPDQDLVDDRNPEHAGAAATPGTDFRVLRLLGWFRVLVAAVLLVLFVSVRDPRVVGAFQPSLFAWTVFAYFLLAILASTTREWLRPAPLSHLYVQLLVDVLAVTTLMVASGGATSGLGSLLFIPIGAAAVTLPRKVAVLAAAMASITILSGEFANRLLGGPGVADFGAAGLLGAVLFVFAIAGNWLGGRVRESEALARRRGVDLANLSQLNAYIVQHLRESIVVVDESGRIRLMNESAASYLSGAGDAGGRHLSDVSEDLHAVWQDWVRRPNRNQEQPSFLSADKSTVIIPHFAALGEAADCAGLPHLPRRFEPAGGTGATIETRVAGSLEREHSARNPQSRRRNFACRAAAGRIRDHHTVGKTADRDHRQPLTQGQ